MGRVINYAGQDGGDRKRSITIAVDETLKGSFSETVTVETPERAIADLSDWKAKGTRLIAFIAQTKGNVIELDDRGLHVAKFDFTLIRTPQRLLDYVRTLVRRYPGVSTAQPVNATPPPGRVGEAWKKAYARSVFQVDLPNEDFENWVVGELGAGATDERFHGLLALNPFKSDRNIALVRRVLMDADCQLVSPAEFNGGVEYWTYDVREVGYQLLHDTWHVDVPKPVLVKLVPKFESIESIHYPGRLRVAQLRLLAESPHLTSVDCGRYAPNTFWLGMEQVNAGQIAEIGRFKNLASLEIAGSESLNDNTLLSLTGLTKLKALDAEQTCLTDASIKTLVGFKNLQTLNINLTEITEAGVSELKRLRPNLRLAPSHVDSIVDHYVLEDNLEAVRRVIEHNPKALEQRDDGGNTPLLIACREGHDDIAMMLIAHGARVDAMTNANQTSLEFAAVRADETLCKLLINQGADVNHADRRGDTPLHMAAITCREHIIRFFLGCGANPFAKNVEGRTPKEETSSRGARDVTAIIADFEAQVRNPIRLISKTTAPCFKPVYKLHVGSLTYWSSKNVGRLTGPLQWSKSPSGRSYLGPLGQQAVNLKLTDLPIHRNVTVEAELFIIGSWDGNTDGAGPDILDISIPGVGTALHSTFFNNNEEFRTNLHLQSFPDPFPFGFHRAYEGASETKTLGFFENNFPRDAVYKLNFTFADSSPDFELVLTGLNVVQSYVNRLCDDENWGIAGLTVKTD